MAAFMFGARMAMLMFLFSIFLIACTTCGGNQMSIQDKYEQMLYTTVRIETRSGGGSGVVIDTLNGFTVILTAKHVIDDVHNKKVRVRFYPSESEYVGEVTKISDKFDLAIVIVMNYEHDFVANRNEPKEMLVFQETYKVGAALGHETPLVTEGIVSDVDEYEFVTSSPIVWGDSGGGIFVEEDGEFVLVGISVKLAVAFNVYPIYHIGIAVDMFAVEEFINDE